MRKRLEIPDEMVGHIERLAAEEDRDVASQLLHMLRCYVPEMAIRNMFPNQFGHSVTTIKTDEDETAPKWSLESPKVNPEPLEMVPEVAKSVTLDFSTEQAILADSIDDADSRKKAQVTAVLEAWKILFPTARKLVHTRAANWIGQRWDSAAEVVDVFLNVAERVAAGKVEVQPSFDNYVAKAIPPTEPRKLPVQTPYTNPDWERGPTREEIERENEEAKLLYEQYGNTWRQQWGIADADGRGSD